MLWWAIGRLMVLLGFHGLHGYGVKVVV